MTTIEPYRAAWNAYTNLITELINDPFDNPKLTAHGLAHIRQQLRPGGQWPATDVPIDLIDQHVYLLSAVTRLYAMATNMPPTYFAEDIVPGIGVVGGA